MTCIIVLGMHRSGTSLVAGICQKLGAHMGEYFRIGDESNPDGYFEDLDWRAMNKWIINAAGGTWYDPPSALETTVHAMRLRPIIESLIKTKSRFDPWGFKDPRTCLTARGLYRIIPDLKFVVVRRPELEIVESLKKRSIKRGYHEPDNHWRALVALYNTQVDRLLAEPSVVYHEIEYNNLINRSIVEDEIFKLADFLCLPWANEPAALKLVRFKDES